MDEFDEALKSVSKLRWLVLLKDELRLLGGGVSQVPMLWRDSEVSESGRPRF